MMVLLAAVAPAMAGPSVPFPHPIITEVLYAVPTGASGDASGDGTRDATGDEFIEIVNPHDRPIQLKGYTLRDRNPDDQGGLRFTFPELELKPKQVAVVFNGLNCTWKGDVGDAEKAAGANAAFGGAFVFTMRNDSEMHGLGNAGDWVLLGAPDGKPVQCVTWGEFEEKPPTGVPLMEATGKVIGRSVQRPALGDPLKAHPLKPKAFSPGVFPLPKGP